MWVKFWSYSILQARPKYVACNSFCKYLAKQPYAKFVQFWPNYQILREFDFAKLLKIYKFSNLLNAKIISIKVNCEGLLSKNDANPQNQMNRKKVLRPLNK